MLVFPQDIHNNSSILSPRAQKRLLSSSQSNSMKDIHHQQPGSPMNQNMQGINQATFNAQQSPMVQQLNLNQPHLILSNLQQDNKSRSHSRLPGIKWEWSRKKTSINWLCMTWCGVYEKLIMTNNCDGIFVSEFIHHRTMIPCRYLLETAPVHCPIWRSYTTNNRHFPIHSTWRTTSSP